MRRMENTTRIRIFENAEMLVGGLYKYLGEIRAGKQGKEGPLHIVLAGGGTPRAFYQFLAKRPAGEIDWHQIHFWWGDERCVPPDHDESNYRMVRESLLDHIDIVPGNIHRMRGESQPESEAQRYGREIAEFVPLAKNGLPVFDLILLGMGSDGHTASIFPDSELDEKNSDYCAVTHHPESGQKRITLTMPVLNQARQVLFMVSGEGKAEVVRQILQYKKDFSDLPAARVRPVTGEIVWFLDREAAKFIED